MAEFQPKRDEALGRRYLQGRCGGVPVLSPAEFEQATDSQSAPKKNELLPGSIANRILSKRPE